MWLVNDETHILVTWQYFERFSQRRVHGLDHRGLFIRGYRSPNLDQNAGHDSLFRQSNSYSTYSYCLSQWSPWIEAVVVALADDLVALEVQEDGEAGSHLGTGGEAADGDG